MLFNSLVFVLFALIFFAVWTFARKNNTSRWITLVAFSFLFYGWWDWRFLFLLIGSGLIDYFAGLYIPKTTKYKKLLLVLSLAGNIGSLAVFKYSGFIAEQIDLFLSWFGITTHLKSHIPDFALILPVGISFYTFQSMSYTIDIYKGKLSPVRNILHFFSYLAMFPQLVAGPIIRARDLLGQLLKYRIPNSLEIWNGLKLVAYGFFQKMVLADNIGPMVNEAFSGNALYDSSAFWWLATIGFGLQIYFDFNGYTLIARGLAKLMGYHFRINFNHPYLSTSIREFWTRWHISLSSWFRDYVYIPLGGNRKGLAWSLLFLWITMLVSGLWHGAAVTFILWGACHALFVSIERLTGWNKALKQLPLGNILNYLIIMMQVALAWVFFRAQSTEQAFEIIGKMLRFDMTINFTYFNNVFFLLIGLLIELLYWIKTRYRWAKSLSENLWYDSLMFAITLTAIIFFRGPEAAFIYFQF